ncbi:MAG TPA: SpoIIE family protein phosphatase [Candidatus Acidoferrum sp.]|nr:SpoIIE family protein phosphatase [Candidatus Acidoferrum sp.]
MTALRANLKEYWRRISRLDLIASAILAAGSAAFLLQREGGLFSFLKFLSVLAGIYLLFRLIGWWRTRLLWSLRNRLIVAYLFIAVVPLLLLLTLAIISGLILYTQLGGYLLYDELQHRVETIANGADQIAAALGNVPPGISAESAEKVVAAQEHAVYDRSLPGLIIEYVDDSRLLHAIAKPGEEHFAGLIQQGDKLSLIGLRGVATPRGIRVVTLRVPVTPEFIATLSPNLGPIQFELLEPVAGTQPNSVIYTLGNTEYHIFSSIPGKRRILQAAAGWWDTPVNGISKFEAVLVKEERSVVRSHPILAFFNARPSRLNAMMFSSVGELGRVYVFVFAVVSVIFLFIEISALGTGIILTRRITKAVSDLYHATQYVQTGDLTHRVRIDRRDQLGVLGESFNLMTSSISGLIEEQKQRQRLENEISIAREVQNQLFPQKLPSIPGVEIEAICKAARTVSGDYYDFVQLSPTHLAIAIADISGKGISAALLMASLQAALRSQMLVDGSKTLSTAELVSRLNKHLVRNTGDDRFATFFIGIYDSATRTLRYTSAGHLPSLLIVNGAALHLDVGGMVLGVVEDYAYEEGSLIVPPDALFVAYSDGLVEPENVYGEEFGIRRLEDAAIRAKDATPLMVAESLMAAAEEWAGTPEQADDMTVIVARLR